MTSIEELTAVALVGSGRRPTTGIAVGRHQLDGDPSRSLLTAASLQASAIRAGATARQAPLQLTPHPPETRPTAPDAARQLLDEVLDGFSAGLELWVACCAAAGYRVPYSSLTRLLPKCRNGFPGPLREVVGQRGLWLGAANPAWADALSTGPTLDAQEAIERWATATTKERERIGRDARRVDPAAGRALVESTWTSDKAADRAQSLRCLAVGLCPDDEDLLIAALDDRSAKVRAAATELLPLIPGSRWAGELPSRFPPTIRLTGSGERTVVIDLPATIEELGDPPPGRSRRGFHLDLVTAATPLAWWTETSGLTPDELLARTVKPSDDLLHGWLTAAMRQGDTDWARAFLAIRPATLTAKRPAPRLPVPGQAPLRSLLGLLDRSVAEPLVSSAIRSLPGSDGLLLASSLVEEHEAWSIELSQAVLARLTEWLQSARLAPSQGSQLAHHLHPGISGELQRLHDQVVDEGTWHIPPGLLADIIAHLDNRTRIAAAFGLDPLQSPTNQATRQDTR